MACRDCLRGALGPLLTPQSDVIVSLDSGFVHLAYALTGALRNPRVRVNHVINFGLPGWNTSGASFWSLGGPTSLGVIDVTTSSGVEAGYVALRRAIAQGLGPTASTVVINHVREAQQR